jgi:hypothetical protein
VEFLAFSVVFGLLATLLVGLRRRSSLPRRTIASLRPGWAEVRGRVRARVLAALPDKRAPISGRECLGWAVLVEQEAGAYGWETVVALDEFGDFELEDDTGSIAVRAASSPLIVGVAEQRGSAGPFDPPPAQVVRLIAQTGAGPRGVLFNKGYRWREWALVDGHEIVVRGRVVSEPGDQGVGYRRMSEILVLAGGASRPLELDE